MATAYAKDQPAGFKNYLETVAIVGAGGQSGSVIAEALIKMNKHKITAITRTDSDSTLPSGLHDVKKVNYQDHNSLVQAMTGQDVLIITMNVMAPPDSQYRLIDAAIEAGVPWIMPNGWGSDLSREQVRKDTMLGERIQAVRDHIAKAGQGKTQVVGLCCGFWYEFSLRGTELQYGFNFPKKTLTLYDDGNTKINTTTWEKVGLSTATLLALKVLPEDENDKSACISQYSGGFVHVSSFYASQRDMFASVLRVTGDKESDWMVTKEDVVERYNRGKSMMSQGGHVGFQMALYARIFFNDGSGTLNERLQNNILGLPEENFDEATKAAVFTTRSHRSRE